MRPKTITFQHVEADHGYHQLERLIADRIASATGPLFTTDASGLWEAYLAGIPEQHRQHYACNCCRRFIERYGGLVEIRPVGAEGGPVFGHTMPLLWTLPNVPFFFQESTDNLHDTVSHAKVNGVFLSSDTVWGTPFNKPGPSSPYQGVVWTHLHGFPMPLKNIRGISATKTAAQAMAELKEDHHMLCRGLAEFPVEAVIQAVRVLEADALSRSEKTVGVAQWLLALHRQIEGVKGPRRDNLIWLAVSQAPPSFCHVRSTMISTLLEDVVAGLPYETIAARWAAKMHPLQYQRPTTVKEGNLKAANELVAKLGVEGSLARRFATLRDVVAAHVPLWVPTVVPMVKADPAKKGGAFDHLREKQGKGGKVKPLQLPPQRIGWDRFCLEVLVKLSPAVLSLELLVPSGRAGFYGLVTAVNPEAPPILQWDGLTDVVMAAAHMSDAALESGASQEVHLLPRNPVSWYFYHGGSFARNWGFAAGTWVKVNAVFLKPPHWQQREKFKHHEEGAMFALEGAKDESHERGGGFFPENLRAEFYGIRAAMEAYSNSAPIAGKEGGDANGFCLAQDKTSERNTGVTVRVKTADGAEQEYQVSW